MIKLSDTKNTRVQPTAITSYYADKHIYTMQNRAAASIQLTIGSCQLEVIYDTEIQRDLDLAILDSWTTTDKDLVLTNVAS
jgi:hypothetical protein